MKSHAHLSDAQLADVLAGCPDPGVAAHLAECRLCARETDALAVSFSGLRSSLTGLAADLYVERATPSPAQQVTARPPRAAYGFLVPAMSFAALALAAAIGFTGVARHTIPASQAGTPAVTASGMPARSPSGGLSDAALLEQVDADLATSVPPSLVPLAPASGSSSASQRSN